MTRRRRALPELERDLYLASRTVGDLDAAQHGRLTRRLARRYEHRWIWRLLRSLGL